MRISVASLTIAPATEPPAAPEPSCRDPAAIVVVPVNVLGPASTSVPSPSFVRLPPSLARPVASVTVCPAVSSTKACPAAVLNRAE